MQHDPRALALAGVLITGITRLAKPHLFSAANNFTDISEYPGLSTLCGFTEVEVEGSLRPHREALRALEPGFDEARMLDDWREMYHDGYRFSPLPSAPRVYNPFTLTADLGKLLTERT